MVIADVSGKGVPAALFMMISRTIIKNCAMLGKSAAEILEESNRAMCSENKMEMFVTVWIGILEIATGRIATANAGHEDPVVCRSKEGRWERVKEKHGFVLGGLENIRYREREILMTPGDKLFVYTDGVPEACNKEGEFFGMTRMMKALEPTAQGTPKDVLASVRKAVNEFADEAEQFDDLTMMCLEYKGTV
jgi:sigma-B regulation protein RsbU (phosphoserine phosphatase)